MPWFGQGGKKGKSPSSTELQVQRSKQIEALRRGNLNVVETLRDAEYRVTVQLAGNNITLIIKLPPQFPQDRPCIEVSPAVRHPWVDSNMNVINCPQINGFTVHSSLQTAVQAIIEEFSKTPPVLLAQSQFPSPHAASRGYPSLFPGPSNFFNNLYPPMTATSTDPSTILPSDTGTPTQLGDGMLAGGANIPDFSQTNILQTFPDLKNKSRMEMLELVNEEEKILELIQTMPEVRQVIEDREKISCKCTDLAKENLSKKPVIDNLKLEVRDKYEEFDRLRAQFETHQEQQLQLMDQFQPSVIQNNLKVAILEAEEESERVVEDFIEKKMDVEDFTAQFLEKRTLYHMRRAKEEKMNHIARQQGY